MATSNRLRRSRRHRILGGVCGGLADWVDWSPTMVRILYVVVSVCSAAFPGILVYLILWLVVPVTFDERPPGPPLIESPDSVGGP